MFFFLAEIDLKTAFLHSNRYQHDSCWDTAYWPDFCYIGTPFWNWIHSWSFFVSNSLASREAWIICPHLRSSFFFFSSKCHWQERRGHIFWSAALFRLQILSVYRKIHPELAVYWANNTYHCPEANLAPTRRSIHNFTTIQQIQPAFAYNNTRLHLVYMQQYLYEIRLRVRSRLKTGI